VHNNINIQKLAKNKNKNLVYRFHYPPNTYVKKKVLKPFAIDEITTSISDF
jgi:hypothetical protein